MIKKLFLALVLMTGFALGQGTIVNNPYSVSGPTTIWSLAGAAQLAVTGSDQACDDGAIHFTEIFVPYTMSATGIFYLVGSVGGTDSVMGSLFNSSGTLVSGAVCGNLTTKAAGAIVGSATEFQKLAFTGGAVTLTPGRYFIAVQFNGTTAKFRSPTIPGAPFICDEDSGTKWVQASITPGTAFVADKGIIGGIY